MTRRIGGTLETAALARLHFHSLTQAEQAAAIRRLATEGMTEHGIAAATGLHVEQVRRVLGHCSVVPRGAPQ